MKINYVCLLFLMHCSFISAISFDYVQIHKESFKKYLGSRKKQMSVPTWVIKNGMRLSWDNYTQEEIDAVAIVFPFFREEKYKEVFYFCDSQEFVIEVNKLLNLIEEGCRGIKDPIKKRIKVHQIIQHWNCQKLNLPLSTSTKQLAVLVEKKQVDINFFCKYQLVPFFLKYYLNI